jgi:hypothetical protein
MVALSTEQSAYSACVVVVIDVEMFVGHLRSLADVTHSALTSEHLIVLFRRHAVLVLQFISAYILRVSWVDGC